MRVLYLAIPVSLLMIAPNVGAQSRDYPATEGTALVTVQITALPQAVRLADDQAESVSGNYKMSNGWRLNVKPTRDGIVAQIDRERPIRLIAVTPEKYVSRSGDVAMEFNRGADRDEMMMSYVPSSNLAVVISIGSTTLASR